MIFIYFDNVSEYKGCQSEMCVTVLEALDMNIGENIMFYKDVMLNVFTLKVYCARYLSKSVKFYKPDI